MWADLPADCVLTIYCLLDYGALGTANKTSKLSGRTVRPAWKAMGARDFGDLGLRVGRTEMRFPSSSPSNGHLSGSWFREYRWFSTELRKFRAEDGIAMRLADDAQRITEVLQDDVVAYCATVLRLRGGRARGFYVEVRVHENADNLTIALVDFDGGGRSSLTYSPECGAVIRETKIQESPRRTTGKWSKLLPGTERPFLGYLGVYCDGAKVAFFEKNLSTGAASSWQSTGQFDLDWDATKGLTPCVAFRDRGAYDVRLTRASYTPPFAPAHNEPFWADLSWAELTPEEADPDLRR